MIYSLVFIAVTSGAITTISKPLPPHATEQDCRHIGEQTITMIKKDADNAEFVCLLGKRD